MRVLSIGHPLPNAAIDNRSIFDAPALFDYEAIVIDPAAVQESIREAALATAPHATSSGVPVVNGESIGGGAGLAELLHRRRDELARALERGAVVAVYLHPPSQLTEVAGMSGLDRYFLLPAPAGMGWDARTVRGGEGRSGAIVDQAHPFSAVVEETRKRLSYRAYLDDRAPGVAEHAHTFVRSTGGAPIGAQMALLGGQLVFLPAIERADATLAMPEAKAMVAAMHEALGRVDDDRVPRWLAAQPVPGLEERERRRQFVVARGLLNVRRIQAVERKRSWAENRVASLLRPFLRFVPAAEHDATVDGFVHELRLRARIAKLKEYRRAGLANLSDADAYDSEKRRRREAAAAGLQHAQAQASAAAMAATGNSGGMVASGSRAQLPVDPVPAGNPDPVFVDGLGCYAGSVLGVDPRDVPVTSEELSAISGGLDIRLHPGTAYLTSTERRTLASTHIIPASYLAEKAEYLFKPDRTSDYPSSYRTRNAAATFVRDQL